mgnify:CR=1 FL=1
MTAYYNEHDPYAARWLENLIAEGLIAWGDVDTRDIQDVSADDLKGYDQVHLFAGIGGWSLALRLAGIPDDRPVWTGSCPCQPFSQAGKQKGDKDERHLWPYMWRLIAEREPAVVFGEQVASALGREWLAGVRTSLEIVGRRVGAADLCVAGAGAPHIRQRLWWAADTISERRTGLDALLREEVVRWDARDLLQAAGSGVAGGLADTDGRIASDRDLQRSGQYGQQPEDGCAGWLGDANNKGPQGRVSDWNGADECVAWPASVVDFWSRYDVVHCTDGKARRFEPGSFPLAHGVSNRVGRLRAYGNAISPQIAAVFIRSYYDGLSLGQP